MKYMMFISFRETATALILIYIILWKLISNHRLLKKFIINKDKLFCQSHEFVKSWNLAMVRIFLYIYTSFMARQAAGQATASYKAFTWMPEWVEAIGLWRRWWAWSEAETIKALKANSLVTICSLQRNKTATLLLTHCLSPECLFLHWYAHSLHHTDMRQKSLVILLY